MKNNLNFTPLQFRPKTISETRNSLGQLHSLHDKPSLIYEDGTKYWDKNNILHREIGPAMIRSDGKQTWAWEGKIIK